MSQSSHGPHLQLRDHSDLLREVESALAWLEGLGVSATSGRHATYRKLLARVVSARAEGRAGDPSLGVSTPDYANAVIECDQLVRIWLGLRGGESKRLRQRLRHLIKGPVHAPAESAQSNSNRSRNVGFELEMAAVLRAAGTPVDEDVAADLDFFHKGHRFFVECKRPFGHAGVPAAFRDGFGQLRCRLDGTRLTAHGVLALSVGRVFWPEGAAVEAQTAAEMQDKVVSWTRAFDRQYGHQWRGVDSRIVGVIVYVAFMGHITGTDVYASGFIPTLIAICPRQSAEYRAVHGLRDQIEAGMVRLANARACVAQQLLAADERGGS